MTFVKSISSCYRNYLNIKGKASRSEFWWFQLYGFIVGLILVFITNREEDNGFVILLGSFFPIFLWFFFSPSFPLKVDYESTIVLLFFFYLFFIPCITCEIRRFADAGLSRWSILLRFVPAVFPYIPWRDFNILIGFFIMLPIVSIAFYYIELLKSPSKNVNVANQQHEQ